MDYNKILEIAKFKLNKKDESIIKDIEDLISIGSTGGEIVGMVGKYLKDLEVSNYQAYLLLKQDIAGYITECKRNGLIIL